MIESRPFRPEDRDAWEPLWAGYLHFYRVELTAGVTDTAWSRLLDPAEDMYGIAAFDDAGRMIGFAHYLFHRVTWSTADRCYLEDLFVDANARGRGAGRSLIEAVYAAADLRGADQVYWLTEEDNGRARALYDRVAVRTRFVKYRRP